MTTYQWTTLKQYQEITFDFCEGIARICINRPHKRNAFTPLTVHEMIDAMHICRDNMDIRSIILTGAGDEAFCSGGDQSVRGHGGYIGRDMVPRLNVLDLQKLIRSIPKVVIAMVKGYAIGGGHVLHVVCDLTIAAENARLDKLGLWSEVLMVVLALHTWLVSWVRKKHERYGISVTSMMQRKHWIWGW